MGIAVGNMAAGGAVGAALGGAVGYCGERSVEHAIAGCSIAGATGAVIGGAVAVNAIFEKKEDLWFAQHQKHQTNEIQS